MRNSWMQPAIFVGGLVVGAGVTYFVTKSHYEKITEEEIRSVKDYYEVQAMQDKVVDVTQQNKAVVEREHYAEQVRAYGYTHPNVSDDEYNGIPEDDDIPHVEVDGEPDELTPELLLAADFKVLLDTRVADQPHVISVSEFMESNSLADAMEDVPEHHKVTLTYYRGDNTLVDEREDIVPDIAGTISDAALDYFGVGSEDESIVYVRNKRLEADYEVILDQRSFVAAMGGSWDASHVAEPKMGKPKKPGKALS